MRPRACSHLPIEAQQAIGSTISAHVELLTFIRRARTLGLHLDDIRKVLDIRSGGIPPCAAVRDVLDERIADIEATVEELLSLRRSLVGTRRRADNCCTDDKPATICSAIEEGAE